MGATDRVIGAHGIDSFVDEEDFDELDEFIRGRQATNPGFLAALEDAAHRSALLHQMVGHRQSSLTQKQVADRMGTTQSAISDLEGGTSDPRLSTLFRYARALDLRLRMRVARETTDGTVPILFARANEHTSEARLRRRQCTAAAWNNEGRRLVG